MKKEMSRFRDTFSGKVEITKQRREPYDRYSVICTMCGAAALSKGILKAIEYIGR